MNAHFARCSAWVAALLTLIDAAAAFAEDYADYDPATAVPEVSAPLFVVLAYSAIWLCVVGFCVMIWRRQRRIELQLAELQQSLAGETATPPERSA
ncbi:MAG: hypothetical protein IPL40_09385 [Proteobacteria bacterium]|nr:hypothetical protein [Pseudomonadota bacterium]